MKKIILICTALVVALGALGIGYAMWYDSIQVNGTVTTGCVNNGSFEVTKTYAYKVLATGGYDSVPKDGQYFSSSLLQSEIDAKTLLKIASAEASTAIDSITKAKTVTLNFGGIYPTADSNNQLAATITYTYGVTGDCTIPVHLDVANMVDPCDSIYLQGADKASTKDVLRTEWSVKNELNADVDLIDSLNGNATKKTLVRSWWDLKNNASPLSSVQLHKGYKVIIKIYLDSDALQKANAQGLTTCPFSFALIVHQWNESPIYEGNSGGLTPNIPMKKTISP